MAHKGQRNVIVLPDIHCPHEDQNALGAVLEYMKDNYWHELIILGDFSDVESLKRFEGPPCLAYQEEISVGAVLLDRILSAARNKNQSCLAAYIEGNHEARVYAYMEKNHAMRGKLSIPRDMELRRRKVKWVPFWSEGKVHKIGNAQFIHGKYVNKYHAFKHADVYGGHTYYGHGHDIQEHTKPVGQRGDVVMAKSLCCLCKLPLHYNAGDPIRWSHAFGVFIFYPDKTHQELTIKVNNGRFVAPSLP